MEYIEGPDFLTFIDKKGTAWTSCTCPPIT